MVITDYRVQSVLRTYTRQLQRSRLPGKPGIESSDPKARAEKVSISDEGRRRLVMERLTNQVFERVYSKEEKNGAATMDSEKNPEFEPATKGNL